MKILHLSTTDIKGGAGIAAYRLHRGLANAGIESKMFVQRKHSQADDVFSAQVKGRIFLDFFCLVLDKFVAKIFGPKSYEITSPALFASMDLSVIDKINPDVVHLNWICGGFLSSEKIKKIKKPIVWTIHDMWPFSGVKHYCEGDKSYIDGIFSENNFLDKWTWNRKKKAWSGLKDMVIVSPSKWLSNEAKLSSLFKNFRIETIPCGIDTNIFRGRDKASSKTAYNLPVDKKIILFGAVDPLSGERKGFKLLVGVIQKLLKIYASDDLVLAVFGTAGNNDVDFGLPTYYMGKVTLEEELAKIYSAADIFVAPSKEDNLPCTVMESMACATPVVAFDIGGMSDMIDHKINGIIVPPFDLDLMAKEIVQILNDNKFRENLSVEARKKVLKEYDINLIVEKYRQLYKTII